MNLDIVERQPGGFKVIILQNGSPLAQVHSYGFMGNVSVFFVLSCFSVRLRNVISAAGSGKSVLWYVNLTFEVYNTDRAINDIPSSSIIEDVYEMRASGLASLAFFYCDFRDDQKRDRRGLISSLLIQLCNQSNAYCAILSDFYFAHDSGSKYASDSELTQCLKTMLRLPNQATTYIIIDALDECPTSTGMPSSRDNVLWFVDELVKLQAPNLRICVTSRPEVEIQPVLGPLAFRSISLHDEIGQAQDIAEYVRFIVNSDPKMQGWRKADKELVIDVLTKKADGM